ncbi:hypothetical protein Nos7524_4646 [Nostoc sp. PCC 7524]|uniref:hypothetical protein n=1 Tax=Nostoc sp. (strain ATCC 29411 / PCC 7524) TaxID=28072 RepID=UPI00029F20D6|nr:hypothetical protein [Nostoc sp. PCC 7524]AFY50391.1 hypothetical protein Nos7524_4646 [Nostoc sp. PCC 7524]
MNWINKEFHQICLKPYLEYSKHLLLFTTSLLASSVLLAAPSRAATFAFSEGRLALTDFSHRPLDSFTNTDVNTISISPDGTVVSEANAIAFLGSNPSEALNITYSEAIGNNKDFLGLAESEAIVKGIFEVEENTLFSFNFEADLNMGTSLEHPTVGSAEAIGDISFALIDISNNNVLDFFQVAANLSTKSSNIDFIDYKISDHIILNAEFADINDENLRGDQKLATAYFNGSVQSYFTNKTSFALIAVNRNQAKVSVSEPSTCIAIIFSCGVMGVVLKRKRQKSMPTYLSAKK